MPTPFRNVLAPLLLVLVAGGAGIAKAALTAPAAPSPPGPVVDLVPGPTEGELKAALGDRARAVGPGELLRVAAHNGHRGRYLAGPALAAALAASGEGGDVPPERARLCRQPDSLKERACLDSLARSAAARPDPAEDPAPRALRKTSSRAPDTVVAGEDEEDRGRLRRAAAADATEDDVQAERNRGYIAQLFVDMREGGMDWDTDDWAVVLYVVVGVVVVGAFVLVGAKALYDLAVNKEETPVFKEVGLRYSYSGHSMRDHGNPDLYRDAHMAGARFAFGLDKDVLALGLAVEGGALNLRLSGLEGPEDAVEYRAGYLVGGPMVRFGDYRPLAFSMEFLNGASSHRSIGWISKARMVLQARTGPGVLLGGHLGAVFYDLEFVDGLVFRRGVFNRDLSLMVGLDAGWAF